MAKTKLTPEMQLAAENAALRQEISDVEASVPNYTRYAGRIPESTTEFNALPKPWKDQIVRENPGLLQDLANRAVIAKDMAAMKEHDGKIAEILADVPFKNFDEYSALPDRERAEWRAKLSREQMDALQGNVTHELTNTL